MAENNGFVDDLDVRLHERRIHDFAEVEKPVIDHDANLQYWRTEVLPTENGFCAVDLFIDKGKFGGRVEQKTVCKCISIISCVKCCFDRGRDSVFVKDNGKNIMFSKLNGKIVKNITIDQV